MNEPVRHPEEFRVLCLGYLNEDFPEEYGDPRAAVRAFVADSTVEQVRRAGEQARALLTLSGDDNELGEALERLGHGYWPPAAGSTHREWLSEVATMLSTESGR